VLSYLFYCSFINYLGKGKKLLINALENVGSPFAVEIFSTITDLFAVL